MSQGSLHDGLKGVIDGIKLSSETKNAEVQKAVGGLKNVAEGMKENFGKMEKVESSRSFKNFKAWNCINFFPGSYRKPCKMEQAFG